MSKRPIHKTLAFWLLIFSLVGVGKAFAQQAKITMDFNDVEIKDMVKSISQITGKNFVVDNTVSGKVSIMSPEPVTVDEAYRAFLAAISVKDYAVCEEGKIHKILKKSTAKRTCGIPVEEDFSTAVGDEFITRIIPIQYIDANEIQKLLRNMTSQTNSMIIAYGPTNSVIVTDSAANIRRMIQTIQKLDKQGFGKSVEVIPLQFAQATEVAEKIKTVYGQNKSRSTESSFSMNIERGAEIGEIIPDVRTNSLIVTASRKGLSLVLDLVAELDRQVSAEMTQGKIHVRRLKHASAEDLADLLSSLLSGGGSSSRKKTRSKSSGSSSGSSSSGIGSGSSSFGSSSGSTSSGSGSNGSSPVTASGDGGIFQDEIRVTADPDTNSLIVAANPTDFRNLNAVIDQLDVRRRQVFVEALILEVTVKKNLNYGMKGHGGVAGSDAMLFGGSNLGGSTLSPGSIAQSATANGLVLGGLTKAISVGGLKIPGQAAIFSAFQENNNLNVLSAPNILTSDNEEASIVVGQRLSVPTSTGQAVGGTPLTTFEPQDVGLELKVTPQINDGNEVTLEIQQKIEELVTTDQKVVASSGIQTNKREAKTTVVAQNGQTVVIGGLLSDKESKNDVKVPLLGDIPLLGALFKSSSKLTDKVNLMVFLTPTIIRDPKDMTRLSVQKNTQRQRFNKTNKIGENKALYKYGYDESLNMAAPASATTVERPAQAAPRKRFNYEDVELKTAEESSPESDEDFRERVSSDDNEIRPRQTAEQSSPNPFADIQPQ